MIRAVLLAVALIASTRAAPAPLTVIVGATLVDAGGKGPVEDAIVVIRDGRIEAVGDRARTPIPKGALLVDGRKAVLAPTSPATGKDIQAEIVSLLSGPAPRIRAGLPAHLALLSGDPRKGKVEVRRRWVDGHPQP